MTCPYAKHQSGAVHATDVRKKLRHLAAKISGPHLGSGTPLVWTHIRLALIAARRELGLSLLLFLLLILLLGSLLGVCGGLKSKFAPTSCHNADRMRT